MITTSYMKDQKAGNKYRSAKKTYEKQCHVETVWPQTMIQQLSLSG